MIRATSTNLTRTIDQTSMALSVGGVAVVGAGLSISSRFPATQELISLLWNALDSDITARSNLARVLGRQDSDAKALVGDSWPAVSRAWAAVAGSSAARSDFQHQFAELDRERSSQPSVAHEALARLVHAGVIECVVSLNWDTAFERAYQRLYGTSLPESILFKPHGDASQPHNPWTLPHEPGVVTPDVHAAITQLRSAHARTLLVVGYSESDQTIVDELVRPLDRRWRTIRVGPHAPGVDDLKGTAENVLPLLAKEYELREDRSAWHPVTFAGSRGVESWLAGQRLGPQDVDSCPEIDEVQTIRRALPVDRAVVLNGPTGSGKSICAYQALRNLTSDGYEVLRLRDNARENGVRSWLTELVAFPHRKVLFIDDAQDLSTDVVRELTESATSDRLVLIVGTDQVAGGVRTVHVSARSAVTRLAQFVREQRVALFPHIRALDDHVGDQPNDFFFEQRIKFAECQETTWQFAYTLTGGWRRVRRQALELRDNDRADLALAALAVAQVAGVDSGVEQSELESLLPVLKRDNHWLRRALAELRSRRLVVDSDGRIRCAHLQAALNVINWNVHPPQRAPWPHPRPSVSSIASASQTPRATGHPTIPSLNTTSVRQGQLPHADIEADRKTIGALISYVLSSPSTPLRGCAWLVGRELGTDARRILKYEGVLSNSLYNQLALRALAIPADGNIAEAAQLLSEAIIYSDGAVIESVKAHSGRLEEWYANIAPDNGWALGELVNSLHQPSSDFAAQVANFADGRRLARLIPDGGWPHIYSSSHALNRLSNIGGESLRHATKIHLDEAAYREMLDASSPELHQIAMLVMSLAAADHELSLRLIEQFAHKIASLLMVDPVRRWNDLLGLTLFVLGFATMTWRDRSNLPKESRSAAQAFVHQLDSGKLARTLGGPQDQWEQMNFGMFIDLIKVTDSSKFTEICKVIDLSKFEEALATPDGRPGRTGLSLCMQLIEQRPDQVHAILDRLEPALTELDPSIAFMAPDVAARALHRGLPLDLRLDNHQWGWAAAVVKRLLEYDSDLALEVVEANKRRMYAGFTDDVSNPFDNLNAWIEVCDQLNPALIDAMIAELPVGAVLKWDRAIRRPERYERWRRDQIAPLVFRAVKVGGHVQAEAEGLLRRFPALARFKPLD